MSTKDGRLFVLKGDDMIKFCLEQWNKNKKRLEEYLTKNFNTDALSIDYTYLVKAVVQYIFNDEEPEYGKEYDFERITEIDNGDYQGTLLYLIPTKTYQPAEYEYLMTYVGYGSCSGCDTLLSIMDYNYGKFCPEKLSGLMQLCLDIVRNTIKPYNTGWRNNELYETVEVDTTEELE